MSRSWDLPEKDATPEAAVLSRRRWLRRIGLGGIVLGAGAVGWWWNYGGSDDDVLASGLDAMPANELYPAATNAAFRHIDRPLTAEVAAARYCNFYEFSGGKQVWRQV